MLLKRSITAMGLSLLLVLSAACAAKPTEPTPQAAPPAAGDTEKKEETPAAAPAGDKIKVVLLIPGTLGDKSFFDSAASGFELINKKYGDKVETKINELGSVDYSKYAPAITEASEEDWDLIMTVGWELAEYLQDIAPQYPDKKYVICDTGLDFDSYDLKNCLSITYKANEGSFLAGALAAKQSKTGKIGFLGGMDTPLINDFLVGYVEGAKQANPDVKVSVGYVGNYEDSGKAKEIALAQYKSDVDIGFIVAGGAGLGQIDAAVDLDKQVIGVDSDQAMLFHETNPEKARVIPSSMVKNVGGSIADFYDDYVAGTVEWGKDVKLGLAEGVIGLADNQYYQELVLLETRDYLKELETKIVSGEIKVSSAFGLAPDALKAIVDSAK